MARSSVKIPKPPLGRSPLATPDDHPLKVMAGRRIGRRPRDPVYPYVQALKAATLPMTANDLAQECGCSHDAAYAWLKKHGEASGARVVGVRRQAGSGSRPQKLWAIKDVA